MSESEMTLIGLDEISNISDETWFYLRNRINPFVDSIREIVRRYFLRELRDLLDRTILTVSVDIGGGREITAMVIGRNINGVARFERIY